MDSDGSHGRNTVNHQRQSLTNEQKSPARRENTRRGKSQEYPMDARIFADFHQMSNERKASTLRQMSADAYQLFAERYNAWMNEHIRNIPGPVDNMLARFAYWLQQQPVPEEPAETVCTPSLDALDAAYEHASRQDMPQAWRNALNKGYSLLLQSGGITVIYAADGSIGLAYIPSQSEPGTTYLVNGECTCQAGQHGKPCAHRAAKRLLNIAKKKQAAWTQPAVLTRENAFPAWVCRARTDLFKDED
jgi:hypothetical protein